MSPVQDVTAEGLAKLWSRMKTVAITTTGASGDVTVHSTTSGLYFLCFYLYVQSANAISVTFKSGSTAISGAIPFLAVGEKTFVADGVPVFKGRAAGEAFVLNASGSTDLRGFAMIAERE
jgi:hypothetical protein